MLVGFSSNLTASHPAGAWLTSVVCAGAAQKHSRRKGQPVRSPPAEHSMTWAALPATTRPAARMPLFSKQGTPPPAAPCTPLPPFLVTPQHPTPERWVPDPSAIPLCWEQLLAGPAGIAVPLINRPLLEVAPLDTAHWPERATPPPSSTRHRFA